MTESAEYKIHAEQYRDDVPEYDANRERLELLLRRYDNAMIDLKNMLDVIAFSGTDMHVKEILEHFDLADGVFEFRGYGDYPYQFSVAVGRFRIFGLYSVERLRALVNDGRYTYDEIKAALPKISEPF